MCTFCFWVTMGSTCLSPFLALESFRYHQSTYVSLYPLWGCGVCSLGSWCFPGVHPAGQQLGKSFCPNQTYFPHTLLLWINTRIPFNVLSWISVSSHIEGKCQTLIYKSHANLLCCSYLQLQANSFPIVCVIWN